MATLDGTGTATYSTTALPVGSASVSAAYPGSSSFAASASSAVTVVVNAPPPPDFSIAASPATLTVAQGASGTSTITIAPLNGFNAAVTFSCSGLPNAASCTFSPTTVTPNGTQAITTSMTVTTTAASASLLHPLSSHPGTPLYGAGAAGAWGASGSFESTERSSRVKKIAGDGDPCPDYGVRTGCLWGRFDGAEQSGDYAWYELGDHHWDFGNDQPHRHAESDSVAVGVSAVNYGLR